jgi:O-acetyl-ADP-ribose deacetylase (regulator of RNase III)
MAFASAAIDVVEGDITRVEADAIVNAANSGLRPGGGVCGAIFRAAGCEELDKACRAIGGCETGSAVLTPAFGISQARFIVHAVGPVYTSHAPEEARRLLASAYRTAINVAHQAGARSVAFPAIGTGIYGYPLEEACGIAVAAVADAAARTGLMVKLVAFDRRTAAALRRALLAS